MSSTVITNVTAILPDDLLADATVTLQHGGITSISQRPKRPPANARIIDGRGGYLAPGLIDIHVHGGAGADFMDGTPEAVLTVCRAHARHGTTTLFPTTTTGSPDQIHRMLSATRSAQSAWTPAAGARIAGVHLYGPFFAEDKVGCHSVQGRRSPLPAEFQSYFAGNLIKIATCAAELPGATAFYRLAKKQRCLITCGHSNASWPEMAAAFKAGMRHVDHFWCAMSNVSSVRSRLGVPMRGSMLEFVLGEKDMSTEVIADGYHLASELLDFAYRMKGAHKLCLVTDANRALDMPPGTYRFGPQEDGSLFVSDGKVGWAPNGSLASSIQGMIHMLRQMKKASTASLPEVFRMASLTPAELTGIAATTGSISPGKQADLLLLSPRLQIRSVFIAGEQLP